MSVNTKHFYQFEDFRLSADDPSLWRGDELISISPKALETLVLLVQKKGEIVSRDELIETVWKDTFVEEGNINYTISLLRKIFDNKELIKTVPRHGYRFTAEVREISKNGGFAIPEPSRQSEPVAAKRPFRLVLALASTMLVLSLVGFAYFSQVERTAKTPETQPDQTSEAMQSYLRGKMILDKRSVDNREEKAIDEFQRAVMLDPTLAIAYAGLAEGFATSAVKIPYPKSRDTIAKAKVAAEKALVLEPNLAEGYLIRGWIKRNADWDWAGAEADLRRSVELSPKNATAHQRLAQTLSLVGRLDEALLASKVAIDLDPISEVIISARFPILEARGDYDIALKESEEFLLENKASVPAARAYATFLFHTQDHQRVIEIGESSMAKNPGRTPFAWLSLLASSYQKTGQPEKADAALKQLQALGQTDTKALYSLTMNYAEMDQIDEAMAALEKCLKLREERVVWLKIEPRFANLRSDPRFQELLRKMNL